MKQSTQNPNAKNRSSGKILLALCLIIVLLALLVFTFQCIFSSFLNILLLIIILLALWWIKKRRENQRPVWQGIVVLILAILLLSWFVIPCVYSKFKALSETNTTETQTELVETEALELEDNDDDDDEAEEAEEAKKAQQACRNIKGNISSSGEKIYHVPTGEFYDATVAEETFCTEAEAKAAGYRKSKQ